MSKTISYGTIVKSELWPEQLKVIAYKPLPGGYVHIVGTLNHSKDCVEQELSASETKSLEIVDAADVDFTGKPMHVLLALEAKRYRNAPLSQPAFAVGGAKVDALPHQIEAVSQALKQTQIRFLIADEPGAGKTIMAGLIAKELKLRHQAKRILIVVPGHLITQWTQEMKTRFEERFTLVARPYVDAHPHENVWKREQQIITSMDFARQDDIRNEIKNSRFELVIVDEAHKMAAYQYGNKTEKTKRYQLGECLSRVTTHLLFLTATPHRGDDENFRFFLELLRPGSFANASKPQELIYQSNNPIFIRRVKEKLKDFQGKPLFLERYVHTKPFRLGIESETEMVLYNQLSEYIREQYNKFSENVQKRNNIAFALVILQRRLASSTYALHISLRRRKKRLEELLEQATIQIDEIPTEQQCEEAEELSEAERAERERQWECLSFAENRDELRDEIETLKRLEQDAQKIIDTEQEIKLDELKKALDELNQKYTNQKILIFTEYADTLEYLAKKVEDWGFSVSVIHGKMNHQKRIEAQETFRKQTQLLIATDAAGEGINLQFCHLMINYDLPWNPNRLEQRMGRIHRYGQKKEVHVINLVAADTREGAVLTRLFEKLQTIRESLGKDSVYDIIGQLFPKKNLRRLILEAAANTQKHEQVLHEIDTAQLHALEHFNRKTIPESEINWEQIGKIQQKEREYGIMPQDKREFFIKTWETLRAKIHQHDDGFLSIPHIPKPILRRSEEQQFTQRYPALEEKTYPKVTFDKEKATNHLEAEFIDAGHPLFEATLDYVANKYADELKKGAAFEDPDRKFNGVIVFAEGEIHDVKNTLVAKRLFACYVPQDDEKVQQINPAIIWNFKGTTPPAKTGKIKTQKKKVNQYVRERLEKYAKKLKEKRERQVEITKTYGIGAFEQQIQELDRKLIELNIRLEKGENVTLAIRNKQQMKENAQKEKEKLEHECQQNVRLRKKSPIFVGAIHVRHAEEATQTDDDKYNKSEIERIGMVVATKHEEKQRRTVEDVSAQNLGFDLRSTASDGKVRYIEVKARSKKNISVQLTRNEWLKAEQLKDNYYLYVVLNAENKPKLYTIQNPAEKLSSIRHEVRYEIPLSEITKAEPV